MIKTSTKKIPVTYILGSGHCGTTLLGLLLGSHSNAAFLGEVHNIQFGAKEMCTCGIPVSGCSVWSEIIKTSPRHSMETWRKKNDVLLKKKSFWYVGSREGVDKKKYKENTQKIYRHMQEKLDVEHIIDSTSTSRAVLLATHSHFSVRVIHITRDVRGVTWSYVKKYGFSFVHMFRWFFVNMRILLIRREMPVPWLSLSYETLVEHTAQSLEVISNFMGVPFEESMLDYQNVPHHQIGGNRMRFTQNSTIKRDERWRREMPVYMRIGIELLFGPFNYFLKRNGSIDK
jgi:hypothetical protein